MKGFLVGTAFLVWSVAVVWGALRRPPVARALLGALFVSMGALVNMVAAITNPLVYVEVYRDRAWIPLYRNVLTGFFTDHSTAIVLTVAVVQVLMGLLVALDSRWERQALIGMIVFLIAVTPLGPENVVNLVFAAGAAVLLRVTPGDHAARTTTTGTTTTGTAPPTRDRPVRSAGGAR